jgi:hypothetical protein
MEDFRVLSLVNRFVEETPSLLELFRRMRRVVHFSISQADIHDVQACRHGMRGAQVSALVGSSYQILFRR